MATNSIFKSFSLDNREYQELESRFGDLCKFAAWQLRRKNVKNNPGVDLDDFIQDLRMALLYAGSYYKRQVYIESCFAMARKYADDTFTKQVLRELQILWKNRTRHGANRQKFGDHQERLLTRIVRQVVPRHMWPKKNRPLEIDKKFITYCKSITWNKQKSLGRRISRERSLRSGLVSLSEYDYLGKSDGDYLYRSSAVKATTS
jgi:hypothetical protein